MTDARRRFWHRAGPLAAFAGLAVASAGQGCGGGGETTMGTGGTGGTGGSSTTTTTTTTGTTTSTTTTSSSSGTGGMGGTGGTAPDIGAAAQDVARPLDATPDPDGANIYFTALDPVKGTGVYKVASAGGAATAVQVGDPFVSPFGIAISPDGTQVYVADIGAVTGPNDADDAGAIFVFPIGGGLPTQLSGTAGTRPRSLEISGTGASASLYFTGRDGSGAVGVFKMALTGGTPSPVVVGAPLMDPGGVAIAANGDVYVVDTSSATTRNSIVYKIASGQSSPEVLVGDVAVGYPAGVALDMAGKRLFVSGLDPATRTDVVIVVDLATKTTTLFKGDTDTDLSVFEEPAGLHRARNKDLFAWADSRAGLSGGTVFKINF